MSEIMTFENAQKILTEYADNLEESKIYIHRDLKTLPEVYISTVNDYLTAIARNISNRNLANEFEQKYEKARGDLFGCQHERDLLQKELEELRCP